MARHARIQPEPPAHKVVLLLGATEAWPDELRRLVDPAEWEFVPVTDVEDLPTHMASGRVRAVLMTPRPWSGREMLILSECRRLSPKTAMVVMAESPVDLPLKRAFEHGATAFLRWPASPEIFLQAISSGQPSDRAGGGGTTVEQGEDARARGRGQR